MSGGSHRLFRLLALVGVGLAVALGAWILSNADWLIFLNWDQATYAGDHATRKYGWGTLPWNAHLAVGQIYFVGSRLSLALGLTVLDGYRLVNALCLGTSAAILLGTLIRLFGGRTLLVPLALTLAWTTSFVELFYVMTLEDNLVYTPFVMALICFCVLRADCSNRPWSWRDSAVAGVLAAFASLGSWQALLYLGAPIWVAAVMPGPGRGRRQRVVDVLAVLASFGITLVLWAALFAATSKLEFVELLRTIFARPSGNFSFYGVGELKAVLSAVGGIGAVLIRHDLTFSNNPPTSQLYLFLGASLLVATLIAFVWATIWSWRQQAIVPHLLAGIFLVNLLAAGLYRDRFFRVLVRFDFVALVLVLAFAYTLYRLRLAERRGLGLLLILLAASQVLLATSFSSRRRHEYGTHTSYALQSPPEPMWYGRENASFFGYFKRLRSANPAACRFVFRIEEFAAGGWNRDIGASLWSELPRHVLIGAPPLALRWRNPPVTMPLADAIKSGIFDECAWISDDVRDLLDRQEVSAPQK